jgi:hypothetical protein
VTNTLLRLGRRLAPGEVVYIIAEADSDGVVDETDETNNTAVLKVVGIQDRWFGVGVHGA